MSDSPLSEVEAHYLLKDLCVQLGYFLPPDDIARLTTNPPTDVDAFVEAVFVAEGFDPELVERRSRKAVREIVARSFNRARG